MLKSKVCLLDIKKIYFIFNQLYIARNSQFDLNSKPSRDLHCNGEYLWLLSISDISKEQPSEGLINENSQKNKQRTTKGRKRERQLA